MNKIWSELDRRLSAIKRYNLFHTIQQQSVAEHVFNVERLSLRIARQWFGITDPATLLIVIEFAHRHEDLEALSGDFPAMSKPYFNEAAFELDNSHIIEPHPPVDNMVRVIVKLADLMDCYLFFCMEEALGSKYSSGHHKTVMIERVQSFVMRNCEEKLLQVNEWIRDMSWPYSSTMEQRGWSEDKY